MKVSVLAILITAATAPLAVAAETGTDCQVDDSRRVVEEQRAAPPPSRTARPTVAQRDVSEQARATPADRRRNGKRIPDAELIGPRGAL
jgi:hypothetical protein